LGVWGCTSLEMAEAQLRVDVGARAYVLASGANVSLAVAFTIALVVLADEGARGLLLGNFGASAAVVVGLWWVLRRRFSLRVKPADLRAMLRFGLPTVPADASVYALQVADRFYLFRAFSKSAAGQYAVAIKLATIVLVAVRGFQYAWPPLAYSIDSDEEAGRLYSLVTTYYALATGVVVWGIALFGAYVTMLVVMYLLTRGLLRVGFEWRRLAHLVAVLAGVAVSGELLLDTSGAAGLVERLAWLALAPAILLLTRFLHPHEL